MAASEKAVAGELGEPETVGYIEQKEKWPTEGRVVLAQYTEDAVLVYQAYNDAIANYALEHQRFGGPAFSPTRMTWIKTNFLWMMFRSGWGTKNNQERTLGIWLRRSAFDEMMAAAVASKYDPQAYSSEAEYKAARAAQKAGLSRGDSGIVRLQWDPDHSPSGAKHPSRRAIQLGLKSWKPFHSGAAIIRIVDLTDFVAARRGVDPEQLDTPSESEYPVPPAAKRPLGLDPVDDGDGGDGHQ
ncbi:uncharacterized protein AMSG_01230 [Thecamonas trahens ATCC 50062]|uniref:DUF4291 domain-containing protein n=1 Tax=Thecamonas trahens ATCC 50062 TaxID=461836 RepID=A0A0L0DMH5_THETB|nr:hypothetical protein AMSG_01230 [Thecamonas trahens ATCC 50062]KNC53517.1 hypothetical protein AMSG_01230 [Thecamonas trahens ATCC 50062]|eukprot:XP_013761838.1 hypothetical protein AMSG_01230 [Thecamonas trahens ATCC 50062]